METCHWVWVLRCPGAPSEDLVASEHSALWENHPRPRLLETENYITAMMKGIGVPSQMKMEQLMSQERK